MKHSATEKSDLQFDFGKNWDEFSQNALSKERLEESRRAFFDLTKDLKLKGASFIDIGFGQGLSLLNASVLGARTFGCDINPRCKEVLEHNQELFSQLKGREIPVVVGSILEADVLEEVRALSPDGSGTFDVVHSWGVLHHTGNMKLAVENALALVKPGGHLIIALYLKHWSSRPWLFIKWLYNIFPGFLQKAMIGLFYPVIYLAKFLVSGRNPKQQERGMDFYYDVVDWVGGYPYEYIDPRKFQEEMATKGYECLAFKAPTVPTGCGEFVFKKTL